MTSEQLDALLEYIDARIVELCGAQLGRDNLSETVRASDLRNEMLEHFKEEN